VALRPGSLIEQDAAQLLADAIRPRQANSAALAHESFELAPQFVERLVFAAAEVATVVAGHR
jgi:hypothetical protein